MFSSIGVFNQNITIKIQLKNAADLINTANLQLN